MRWDEEERDFIVDSDSRWSLLQGKDGPKRKGISL